MTTSRYDKRACILGATSLLAIAVALAASAARAQNAPGASASGVSSPQPAAAPAASDPAPAGARKQRQKPGDKSIAAALGRASAPGSYAFAVKAPRLPVVPAWIGPYAGVSFGPALIRAGTSVATHFTDLHTFPATPASPVTLVTTDTTDTLDLGNGRRWGALSDVFLGYNFRVGYNLIAGVQAEGTIANAQAQLDVGRTNFDVFTQVFTPPGVPQTQTTLTTSSFLDAVSERWAASVLFRLGILVDPHDLVYGIGGYTYGGFAWSGRSFGLNGATVGAGWEHEIAPAWTFKAEYRYTAFESKDVSLPATAQTFNEVGDLPNTEVVNSAETARVSGINLQAFRFGLTHYRDGNGPAAAAGAYAKAPRDLVPASMQPWEGIYGGASFGLGWIKAATSLTSHTVQTQTQTSPGSPVAVTSTTTDLFSPESGSGRGALTDIYAGYNVRLGDRVVAGVQAEGTLADNQAQMSFAQTSVSNATTVTTPPGTTTTQSTVSTLGGLDEVTQRWGVSALAKVGVLAGPRDLVYAIGGYTYGGFQWDNHSFGLNGATVGGGWEHEIVPTWTFKGEYRYTAFENKDLPFPSGTTLNQTFVDTNGGVTTTVGSGSVARTDRVSGFSTQALRFGISHYFGGADGAAGPSAKALMPLKAPKAPPAAAPMWTGLYAGGSFGLTSVQTRSDSVQNQLNTDVQTDTGLAFSDVVNDTTPISFRNRHAGYTADLSVGYNVLLAPRVIGGVQLEAGLAHAVVAENGLFTDSFTETQVQNGVTTTGTETGSGNLVEDELQMRWMASALVKAGWLVDPRDLVYVVGGWSYGAFTFIARPFGLNGPTVGGGWEHEIAPGWSVKAEYRFAQLRGGDIVFPQPFTFTQTSGTFTNSQTSPLTLTDHFVVDLHAVRIGVSHYFGTP